MDDPHTDGMPESEPAPGSSASPKDGGVARQILGLGIDVGGTGVKMAVVDLERGTLVSDRVREKTPDPSTPEAVVETIGRLAERLEAAGHRLHGLPTGCGLPGVVKDGRLLTAANIDKRWVDAPAAEMLTERLGHRAIIINDADAAGVAEMAFGAGVGRQGVVLMLTLGTGIGSGLFVNGLLVPNTELGHLTFHRRDAETLVSATSRERRGIGWKRWAREFSEYLALIDRYLWPDVVILGGGISKVADKWLPRVNARMPLVTARLLNEAGIVGAALAAAGPQLLGSSTVARVVSGAEAEAHAEAPAALTVAAGAAGVLEGQPG